jgi:hypothetical protein
MAITQNTYTGNGSNKLFSITFPYLSEDHVKVYLNNVLQTITSQYTFANLTTIEFNTAPGNGATVKLARETDSDEAEATFFAGSPIRATDLNENQSQSLYLIQETQTSVDDVVSTAEEALDTAQGAVDAISVVVPYIPVANYAALLALTPVNGSYYELQNSTGATTPTVTGIPVGLVGAAGLTFRLQYNGTSFAFLNYFANDSESRYLKLSGGNMTGDFSVTTDTFFVDAVNDRVGIGTNAPETELDIKSQGTNDIRSASGRHYDNTNAFSHFKWIGGRARGSTGNPSAVLANDSLVSFNGRGYKASAWSSTIGGYYIYAAENWTNTATGMYLAFRGTPTGSTTTAEWARFDQDALLLTNQRDLRFGDSDNSHWVAFQAPATVSSNVTWTLPATDSTGTQALVSNGSGTLAWGSMTTTATAVSATGTSVEFLSIPSWVNRIHFMFDGVSSSGSGSWLIQLGDSGGYETTGYVGAGSLLTSTVVTTGNTSGFILPSDSSSTLYSGVISISRLTGNTWTASGSIGNEAGTDRLLITGGSKTLSDVLTQVRLVNVLGTDTFDAGTINISYNS